MFILQDGKLYVQSETQLVGVDIYSDKTVLHKDETAKLGKVFTMLTMGEVKAKFQINEKPYKFPVKIPAEEPQKKATTKGAVKNDTTGKTKTATTRRKS